MKKLAFAVLVGGLILTGAGCADEQPTTNNTSTPPADTTNTTPTTNTDEQPVGDFTLSGEATVFPGEVKLQWSAPADMDPNNKFRLFHSAAPGRTVEQGAFWQNLGSSSREHLWTGITSGKRYFRVCEFNGATCVRTSNEIEITVK